MRPKSNCYVKWKRIPDFPKYWVSNQGDIYSTKHSRNLKPWIDHKGYPRIWLFNGKRGIKKYVHCLVAMLFIPNPAEKPQVNHLDGIKTNNNVWNLDWVTNAENMQHGYDTGIIPRKRKRNRAKELTT